MLRVLLAETLIHSDDQDFSMAWKACISDLARLALPEMEIFSRTP